VGYYSVTKSRSQFELLIATPAHLGFFNITSSVKIILSELSLMVTQEAMRGHNKPMHAESRTVRFGGEINIVCRAPGERIVRQSSIAKSNQGMATGE
jgi:hypothetical protein